MVNIGKDDLFVCLLFSGWIFVIFMLKDVIIFIYLLISEIGMWFCFKVSCFVRSIGWYSCFVC